MQKNNRLKYRLLSIVLLLLSPLSAAQDKALSLVSVDQVKLMTLSSTSTLMGTVHSHSHLEITAGIDGQLEWLAKPGTYIKKDEALVKMDLTPLQIISSEQELMIKQAQIKTAYLKTEFKRLKKLHKAHSASDFQLASAQSQYELEKNNIAIERLKLSQSTDKLSRAIINAPFDGVVTQRIARSGKDVNRSEVLLTFIDTQDLEVRLFVPIKFKNTMTQGSHLQVHINEQAITCQVIATIPSADPLSQTYEVIIQLKKDLNPQLTIGELLKVSIPLTDAKPSLTVHRDALILRKEGIYIIKIDEKNKAKRLAVIVGKGNRERVSIEADIQHGEQVAVRGAEHLKDGQEVQLQ